MYFTPALTFSVPAARVGLGAAVFATPTLKTVFTSRSPTMTASQKAAYKREKRNSAAASPAGAPRPDEEFESVAAKLRGRSRRSREDLARAALADDSHLNPFSGRLSKRKVLDVFSYGKLSEHTGRAAMGPVQWEYKPLPRRERPMDADDVLNDSAFTAKDTMNMGEDEDIDDVTSVVNDLTPDSDAKYASYTEAKRDAAPALFNRDPGFAPLAATGADDAGFPHCDPVFDNTGYGPDEGNYSDSDPDHSVGFKAGEGPAEHDTHAALAMELDAMEETTKATEDEDTTAYSDLPYASFVSLEDTLVGSTGDLHGCAFDAKMDVFDTEAAEDIVVDDDEDHMITTGTADSDLDVDMADASCCRKFKFTRALKRVLAPAVAGPKKILIGLASKRNFAPYNPLRSRSRRVLARSSEAADSPDGC